MKQYFLIVFATFLLLTSCDNATKYKTELDEISNYQSKLDSLTDEINGIKIDSLIYMQAEAAKNERIIKQYYAPDTIDVAFVQKLNKGKSVHKSLKNVETQKQSMLTEIEALKIQFSNLEKDILEGLYDKEQITDYLNVEKLDYDILELNFKDFNLNQQKQKNNFYFANPQIAEYVEILLNENKTP